MITAYFTNINSLHDDMFNKLWNKVNINTQQRLLEYRSRDEQIIRLCGKLLLHKLLAGYSLEREYDFNSPEYGQFGKPYFSSDFDFNITHSGHLVVCAGILGGKIGVDAEKNEYRDIGGMKEYFTTKEWDRIISDEDANAAFYEMWVRKEACLKAIGRGLLLPMNEIDVCDDEVVIDNSKWYLHNLYLKESYATCIATNEIDTVTVREVDINTLINQQ